MGCITGFALTACHPMDQRQSGPLVAMLLEQLSARALPLVCGQNHTRHVAWLGWFIGFTVLCLAFDSHSGVISACN